MAPQIRITENIEGRTFENAVFIKSKITFEGKEIYSDSKDNYCSMNETMIEIKIDDLSDFLKVYMCQYAHENGSQPHVFIDGIATGFNELDRCINFFKIVNDYVSVNMV